MESSSSSADFLEHRLFERSRKRDSQWLKDLSDEGLVEPIKVKSSKYDIDGVSAIVHFKFANGEKFGYVQCSNCSSVLKKPSGGHWTRHQKKLCSADVRLADIRGCQEVVKASIVEYCLASGTSFRQLESNAFRRLLRQCMSSMHGSLSPDSILLPCRQTIRDSVEKKCLDTITDIGKTIVPHIQSGSATLILDFGLHIYNYLSGFVSFIVENDQGKPALKVEPFCFTPMYAMKTAENIKNELVRAGVKFQLKESEILSMNVITDGAANVSLMGSKYFKNWSLCSCHALQKMSERLLTPKKSLQFLYSQEEVDTLNECSDLLKQCAKLSLAVHKHKQSLRITKLPTIYIETRWQSAVKCAKDVESLLPMLKKCKVSKILDMAGELDDKVNKLRACIEALQHFEPMLSFFEETAVNIHLFLPMVYEMNLQFCQLELETDDSTIRALNKSGRIVTEDYLENKISNLHLKATLLSPRLKRMTKVSSSHKKKAIDILKEDLENLRTLSDSSICEIMKPDSSTINDRKFGFLYDDVDLDVEHNEFEDYINERVTSCTPECPLMYWSGKKTEFPLLSKIAFNVFSAVSSESVCERSFSAVKRIIRDDRHRMQPDLIENIMIGFFHANEYE